MGIFQPTIVPGGASSSPGDCKVASTYDQPSSPWFPFVGNDGGIQRPSYHG